MGTCIQYICSFNVNHNPDSPLQVAGWRWWTWSSGERKWQQHAWRKWRGTWTMGTWMANRPSIRFVHPNIPWPVYLLLSEMTLAPTKIYDLSLVDSDTDAMDEAWIEATGVSWSAHFTIFTTVFYCEWCGKPRRGPPCVKCTNPF